MKFSNLIHFIILCTATGNAWAEIIDPVAYIKRNGYQSAKLGDDGLTKFLTHTVRVESQKIRPLEADVESLPKHPTVYQVCDMMRGGVKARLIQETGIAFDVAATNYGYKGKTIVCVLKYMRGNQVGTQILYGEKGPDAMYQVFVVD